MVTQVVPAGEVRVPTTHLLTTPYFNRTHCKARIDGLMSFKTVDLQIGLNAKDFKGLHLTCDQCDHLKGRGAARLQERV